jgi:hypothetical protein
MMGLFFQYKENGLWSRGGTLCSLARSLDRLVPLSCTRLLRQGAWEKERKETKRNKKNKKEQKIPRPTGICFQPVAAS